MRHLRSLAFYVLLALWSQPANAQRLTPRAATAASLRSSAVPRDTVDGPAEHPLMYDVARGAGIGGMVGVGTGVLAAVFVTHQSRVTDHSEDGLAYMVLGVVGGTLGFVLGAIVGGLSH